MSTPAAGWYVNPSGPGRRYWDGARWTEHIDDSPAPPYSSPAAGAAPPPPPQYAYAPPAAYPPAAYPQAQQGTSGLVIVGYITAVLIPIVGFILGIVVVTRRYEPQTSRHGVWIIVLSIVAFIIWYAILSQDTYSTTY